MPSEDLVEGTESSSTRDDDEESSEEEEEEERMTERVWSQPNLRPVDPDIGLDDIIVPPARERPRPLRAREPEPAPAAVRIDDDNDNDEPEEVVGRDTSIYGILNRWNDLREQDKASLDVITQFVADMTACVVGDSFKHVLERIDVRPEMILSADPAQGYTTYREFLNNELLPAQEYATRTLSEMSTRFTHTGPPGRAEVRTPPEIAMGFYGWNFHVVETFRTAVSCFAAPLSEVIAPNLAEFEALSKSFPDRKKFKQMKPSAQIQSLLARAINQGGYTIIHGRVYHFIEGTFRHAVEPVNVYTDVCNEDSAKPQDLKEFLNEMVRDQAGIQAYMQRCGSKCISEAVSVFELGRSNLLPKYDLRYDFVAYKNGLLRIALGKKRARAGEFRPGYQFLPYERVVQPIIAARYIDAEFDQRALELPFGFLRPKDDPMTAATLVMKFDEKGRSHMSVARREGEDALAHYMRFLDCFEIMPNDEFQGPDLITWVKEETTSFISDIFAARLACIRERRVQRVPDHENVEFLEKYNSVLSNCYTLTHCMSTQHYTDQEMFIFFVMIGRSFFASRTFDNWQCFLLMPGMSRTGKGILLDLLFDFHGREVIGQIKNDTKDLFSNAGIIYKRILYFPDIQELKVFTPEMILKCSSNERDAWRQMRTDPFDYSFTQRLYMITNVLNLLEKGDKQGALSNRGVILGHYYAVPTDVFNTELEIMRKSAVGWNMAACVRAVTMMRTALGSRTIMDNLPATCRRAAEETRTLAHFAGFLEDEQYLRYRHNAAERIPFATILGRFHTYMADKNPGIRYEANIIFHSSPAVIDLMKDRGFDPQENLIGNVEIVY